MSRRPLIVAVCITLLYASARADDSALVRLLKSGRVPEERQPQIIAKIGQLGTPTDLAFLLDRAADPKGFAPALRAKALDALVEATITRKEIKPAGNLLQIMTILERRDLDKASRIAAIRLAGLWRIDKFGHRSGEQLGEWLEVLLEDEKTDDATRTAVFETFAAMGNLGIFSEYTTGARPRRLRALAVAVLARSNPVAAARRAAGLIREAGKDDDLAPLIAAFLNLKDGAAVLSKAIEAEKISPDNAKITLRAVYALGHADAPLVAALSKAAGIENETTPPTKEQMDMLVAEVASKGNAARGERVLRRADLNCMKCHAITGAAGGVGPDLSSVGLSSPVDYVINSILLPDQAIKEQYQTLIVATTDGQVFQGIVADKDESKIVLKQATGELRTVPTSEIDETKAGGSLMPKGLSNLLTHDEFVDLVRFLSELGKPGPYAIRDVPTIQRWRLMTPVPDDLANSVPDAGAFVARVRDSDPSAWVAAYGLANGEVPIDEFSLAAGSPILYLRGEIEVSTAGMLAVDLGSVSGVTAWLDDVRVEASGPKSEWKVEPGKHAITLRVNTRESKNSPVKVQVSKAKGSSAEFVVVGGR